MSPAGTATGTAATTGKDAPTGTGATPRAAAATPGLTRVFFAAAFGAAAGLAAGRLAASDLVPVFWATGFAATVCVASAFFAAAFLASVFFAGASFAAVLAAGALAGAAVCGAGAAFCGAALRAGVVGSAAVLLVVLAAGRRAGRPGTALPAGGGVGTRGAGGAGMGVALTALPAAFSTADVPAAAGVWRARGLPAGAAGGLALRRGGEVVAIGRVGPLWRRQAVLPGGRGWGVGGRRWVRGAKRRAPGPT